MVSICVQNGWVGNAGTHYAFECNDLCCGPSPEHPKTETCGMLFARFDAPVDDLRQSAVAPA